MDSSYEGAVKEFRRRVYVYFDVPQASESYGGNVTEQKYSVHNQLSHDEDLLHESSAGYSPIIQYKFPVKKGDTVD